MRLIPQALAGLLTLLCLLACRETHNGPKVPSSGPPVVYTVNYPLAYFADRIAAGSVEVVFPAPSDIDPAFWKPDPEMIVAYQKADLILLNGAAYAKWVRQVSLPLAKQVDCGASQKEGFLATDSADPHTHGPAGEHSHGELAFTLWVDPDRALRQAKTIHAAFIHRWPAHEDRFDKGFESLREDLLSIDLDLYTSFEKAGGQPVLFSHPVYQYLQERFSLNGRSLHWEPDADPGEKEWSKLDRLLAEHPATVMIWEGEPLPAVRTRLAGRGIRWVVFDPCANKSKKGDYLAVMRRNVEALKAVWGAASPSD